MKRVGGIDWGDEREDAAHGDGARTARRPGACDPSTELTIHQNPPLNPNSSNTETPTPLNRVRIYASYIFT